MTLKNCERPTAGAIIGRTPFLLFVGTWDTNLNDHKGKAQSRDKAIEKMINILKSSYSKEL